MSDQEKDYHVVRARAELDAAYRAETSEAAARHFRLCGIHMRRAQGLADPDREAELVWLERCAPLHESRMITVAGS